MRHNRGQKTITVQIGDIDFDRTADLDQRYLALIGQQYRGKLKVALTRLPIDGIISGFFKRESGISFHVPSAPTMFAETMRAHLHLGGRPALEVYWNNLAPGGGSYVCPDGEWLAIYEDVGISRVPVRILKPNNRASLEGAIWIEADAEGGASLERIVGPEINEFPAYRDASGRPTSDALWALCERCIAAECTVEAFHHVGGEVQYHEMLHAVLRRHRRSLESISMLIDAGRLEHASLIARAAYEAFLNFYLDWLAPEFLGPESNF